MTSQEVLKFWFEELKPEDRFKKDPGLDAEIRRRFLPILEAAEKNELWTWRRTPEGSLAEIIILDQFTRNVFRGEARSFASDALALSLSQAAIEKGFHLEMTLEQRAFLYMPFMHSESLIIHEQAVKLFSMKGLEFNLKYELAHRDLIVQFGRYPHRNKILGRDTTLAEAAFLRANPEGF